MGGPHPVGPFECNLRATAYADDPCLQQNPNFAIPLEAVETVPDGRVYEGYASWYARGFHGQHTATGEVYDAYDYTIAMRERHMHGAYVRIECPDTGKMIIARVSDWGPATAVDKHAIKGRDGKARVADLSKGVFYALGDDRGFHSGQLHIRITPVRLKQTAAATEQNVVVDLTETKTAALETKWEALRDVRSFPLFMPHIPTTVRTAMQFHYSASTTGGAPKRIYDGYVVLLGSSNMALIDACLEGAAGLTCLNEE